MKKVQILNGENKGMIGYINAETEECICETNSHEAVDCDCYRQTKVYNDSTCQGDNYITCKMEELKILND